jgi:lipoprotein NlpI
MCFGGCTLIQLGNFAGALTYFDKVLSIDPTNEYALRGKGWTLGNLAECLHFHT